MTSFKNLTPHAISIVKGGVETTFPPSGVVARVSELTSSVVREVGGFPCLSRSVFDQVVDLPPPEDGVVFIVSSMVAAQVLGRPDVVSPATGPKDGAVRNEKGHIVAVTHFKES